MEPWLTDILKVAFGGFVTLFGLWLAHRVQQKAARTQERQVEVNAFLEVGDKWKEWAESLEARQKESDARSKAAEDEVATLRPQVSEVRGLFNVAVKHISDLRALIVSLGYREQLPDLPDDIAHMIPEDPKKEN